jgi:hypothetical protein
MDIDWGVTVRFGLLDDEPDDILDHLRLTADSAEPEVRVQFDGVDVGSLRDVVAGAAADSAPGTLDTAADVW